MSQILDAIQVHARDHPDQPALQGSDSTLDFSALWQRIDEVSTVLRQQRCRVVGIMSDNSVDWIVTDLAALRERVTVVPLPPFFSASQLGHLFVASDMDTLLVDDGSAAFAASECNPEQAETRMGRLRMFSVARTETPDATRANDIAKITFTSGSTGAPRGVCLAFDTIDVIASRLRNVLASVGVQRHLCVTPLATLLENVAGVYVPLMLGATVHAPSLASVGISGATRVDSLRFARAVEDFAAESLILSPALLRALAARYSKHGPGAHRLKFVAVGGARVAQSDLDAAAAAGIPAYQGYGLSECCSVVALNHPGASRPGSVGRPLPGVGVDISPDGEVIVSGQGMRGYLGDRAAAGRTIRTGDIGQMDADGYLYVTGRKKNLFITSFGRNVSPEWPEAELLHQAEIAQACVFGEARPFNTAVIVPTEPTACLDALADAIRAANANLPDYARISLWTVAQEPFSAKNGLLTPTGKVRREAVQLRYATGSNGATDIHVNDLVPLPQTNA